MIGKDLIVCLGTVLFLVLFSYYSFAGYQAALELTPYGQQDIQEGLGLAKELLELDTIEGLAVDVGINQFTAIAKRNPFIRFKSVVKAVQKKPIKIELPKPKFEPVKVEEPEPVPIENYFFRGKVILGDEASYAIERESDGKTFFVNKGDQTRDFIVLETSEKQVVITDYNENIRILKKS